MVSIWNPLADSGVPTLLLKPDVAFNPFPYTVSLRYWDDWAHPGAKGRDGGKTSSRLLQLKGTSQRSKEACVHSWAATLPQCPLVTRHSWAWLHQSLPGLHSKENFHLERFMKLKQGFLNPANNASKVKEYRKSTRICWTVLDRFQEIFSVIRFMWHDVAFFQFFPCCQVPRAPSTSSTAKVPVVSVAQTWMAKGLRRVWEYSEYVETLEEWPRLATAKACSGGRLFHALVCFSDILYPDFRSKSDRSSEDLAGRPKEDPPRRLLRPDRLASLLDCNETEHADAYRCIQMHTALHQPLKPLASTSHF